MKQIAQMNHYPEAEAPPAVKRHEQASGFCQNLAAGLAMT